MIYGMHCLIARAGAKSIFARCPTAKNGIREGEGGGVGLEEGGRTWQGFFGTFRPLFCISGLGVLLKIL
jgi:hypothetical protein